MKKSLITSMLLLSFLVACHKDAVKKPTSKKGGSMTFMTTSGSGSLTTSISVDKSQISAISEGYGVYTPSSESQRANVSMDWLTIGYVRHNVFTNNHKYTMFTIDEPQHNGVRYLHLKRCSIHWLNDTTAILSPK